MNKLFNIKNSFIFFTIILLSFTIIFISQSHKTSPPEPKAEGNTIDYRKTIINTSKPQTYQVLQEHLRALTNLYSPILRVESIGASVMERKVFLVRMGEGKKKVLVVGGIHGREWLTGMLLTKMIEEYAKAVRLNQKFDTFDIRSILKKSTLLFVPVLNPDGVEIAIRGLEAGGDRELLLRANEGNSDFRKWKANGRGVNLNIQYAAHWEEAFSKPSPHHEKYKGPEPGSEPESRAIVRLINDERPGMVLSYHSSGEVIYWYYGQEGPAYARDLRIAERIKDITGYRLAREERIDTHGGLKDWFILEHKKPGYTIEIGKSMQEEPLPITFFKQVYNENKTVLLSIADNL